MSLISWIVVAVFMYLFYSVISTKYKTSKRDELKYDDTAVQIPLHVCTTDDTMYDDLAFEEFEKLVNHQAKAKLEKVAYKTVAWEAIHSWEYKIITQSSSNHSVWLEITTANETIKAQITQRLKMKWYFKKNARGKQIKNKTNTIEMIGEILSIGLIALIIYNLFFR